MQDQAGDLLAFEDALARLTELNERQAKIVELRVFGGLAFPDIAAATGLGLTTVKADWRFARALLHRMLPDAATE